MTRTNQFPTEASRSNRLASPFLLGELLGPLAAPLPPLQVRETDEGYALRCELPGYEQEEVQVELTGDVLEVRAAGKADLDGWGPLPARAHSVRLTTPIDGQKVEAELRDGVLLVRVPKSEAARPRRIAIQTGRSQPAQLPAAPETGS